MKVGDPSRENSASDRYPPQTPERNEGGTIVFNRHVLPTRESGAARFLLANVVLILIDTVVAERRFRIILTIKRDYETHYTQNLISYLFFLFFLIERTVEEYKREVVKLSR